MGVHRLTCFESQTLANSKGATLIRVYVYIRLMSDQSRRISAQPIMNNVAAAAKKILSRPLFKHSL
jgi:hypothetical protein